MSAAVAWCIATLAAIAGMDLVALVTNSTAGPDGGVHRRKNED